MTPTTSEKYAQLIRSLLNTTADKAIDWSIDPWDQEVSAHVGGRKLRLTASRSSNGEPLEKLEIMNGDDVIDSFTDINLADRTPPSDFITYFHAMKELRRMAQRQAKGADDALDDILNDLNR